jgi:LVIVD repeat-containing protein
LLVGCARNLLDQVDFNTGEELPGGVKIVDATNPTSPLGITSWQLDVIPFSGIGCLPVKFAHSLRFENGGNNLYVSYWDAGTVHLDLSDPTAPVVVSDTVITPPDEDGDNHSMTLANGGSWLVINPEDFSPSDCPGDPSLDGWGEAYVYDQSDLANPSFLGTFSTPDSRSERTDGIYTVHNTEVALGRQFFSSWYSDGIVWWTMDDNGASHQLGQFVPPASELEGVPLVWGVYVDHAHNLVLASDFGSGLWIVRPKGLKDF